MQKIFISISLIIFPLIIIYIENQNSYFGKFINSLWPCQQNPLNSLPCYNIYDILLILTMLAISLSSIIILTKRLISHFLSVRKKNQS